MGTAGDCGAWRSGIGSGGIVVARTASFTGDSGSWGHDMVASDIYGIKRDVREVNGFFFTISLFPIGV
jgi:hypothetical protein